jgi:hypothetical protein
MGARVGTLVVSGFLMHSVALARVGYTAFPVQCPCWRRRGTNRPPLPPAVASKHEAVYTQRFAHLTHFDAED